MGHAMEYLLGPRHDVQVWQRPHGSNATGVDLAAAAAGKNFVILCVPAAPVEQLALQLRPALTPGAITLSISKGLDEAGRPAAQALAAAYGDSQCYGVLYGPMISEEIRAGRPAFADLALNHADGYAAVHDLFRGSRLALKDTRDVNGISWAAILKNVYAIAVGVGDELRLGDNLRGYLIAQAVAEMQGIISALGYDPASVQRLAGLADLVTTATSVGSHHHELGRRLARGETEDISGEGVHTLAMIRARKIFDPAGYRLYRLVEQMVESPADSAGLMAAYLDR